MAPRLPRRRGGPDDPDEDPDATVDLSDADHAWWAQRAIEDVWRPRPPTPPTAEEPPAAERDVLADHFGADWRTTFGFDPPPSPPPEPGPTGATREPPDPDERPGRAAPEATQQTSDPYTVLEVAPTASWDEIVDAHRHMARRHHPDRLVDGTEAQVAAADDRIRAINAAYAELKVRRGR